jgi:hypothetical protein
MALEGPFFHHKSMPLGPYKNSYTWIIYTWVPLSGQSFGNDNETPVYFEMKWLMRGN